MKFITPAVFILMAAWAVPAAADCFNMCLSRVDCKMKLENGKVTGPEKCVQVYSQCETECKSSYGAVALGAQSGAWGLARKSDDAKAAADSAMAFCSQREASDCQVAGQFKNLCAAVARGGNVTSWAGATDAKTAGDEAVAACAQKGGQDCAVRMSECYFN